MSENNWKKYSIGGIINLQKEFFYDLQIRREREETETVEKNE